jgi:hypothetical protein
MEDKELFISALSLIVRSLKTMLSIRDWLRITLIKLTILNCWFLYGRSNRLSCYTLSILSSLWSSQVSIKS